MNIAARQYKDKTFTVVSYACVLLLGGLLLVVLIPMIGRGLSAVAFRETVEFRRMQYAIFDRGNEVRLKADIAAVEAARRPIYDMVDSFSRGIDTQSQIDSARDIYRRFGDELRLRNLGGDAYSDLRGQAKEMRNALTEACEAIDRAEARARLDEVLVFADRPEFKGTAVEQYFEMARAYGRTIEKIDLDDRQRYAAQLDEVKEALRKLFGPRPGEEMPPLAENQFGATRWDLVQRHLTRLLYAEQWVQTDPSAPMEKKLIPRTDPSQFGGTELEPLFGRVESNLDVPADEGVDAAADHGAGFLGHWLEVEGDVHVLGVPGEGFAAFGDVDGEVADALQVVVDFQRGDNEAQVDGDGLVKGENLEAFLFDVDFHVVVKGVAVDDFTGGLGVEPLEGLDGAEELVLDEAAELEELAFEFFDGADEVFRHRVASVSRIGR